MNVKRKARPPTEWVREIPTTLAAWGSPRDEIDGVRVAGIRIVRTPDGGLVGIQESTEPPR